MEPTPALPELNPDPRVSLHHPSAADSDCLATALELQLLLKEEADILKRFAGSELLWLIPKKEMLVSELGQKLNADKAGGGSTLSSDELKVLLGEIDELNRTNGLFILRTLSYWQDLLSIFSPQTYGPSRDGSRPAPALRGHAFSREI